MRFSYSLPLIFTAHHPFFLQFHLICSSLFSSFFINKVLLLPLLHHLSIGLFYRFFYLAGWC
jgi:hypothetical protein